MVRTPAQYLSDHSNDAEAALAAAVADVNTAYGENHTARSFRRTFEPLLRELDIPSTQEGAEMLREHLTADQTSADVEELSELVADLTGLLTEMGIDFDAPEEELAAQLEELAEGWQEAQAAIFERDTMKADAELDALAGKAKASSTVFKDLVKRDGLTPKLQGEGDAATVHLFDKDGKDLGPVKDYAEKTPAWKEYGAALFPQAKPQGGVVIAGQAGAGGARSTEQDNPLASAYRTGNAATGTAQVVRPSAPISTTGG